MSSYAETATKNMVEEAVAFEMNVIKLLIEDRDNDDVIPLPNVTSEILETVIE